MRFSVNTKGTCFEIRYTHKFNYAKFIFKILNDNSKDLKNRMVSYYFLRQVLDYYTVIFFTNYNLNEAKS